MDKKARSNGMVEFSLKVWVRVFISEDDLRMEPEFDQIIRSDKDLAEKEQLVEELIVKIANDRLVEASVSAGKDYGVEIGDNGIGSDQIVKHNLNVLDLVEEETKDWKEMQEYKETKTKKSSAQEEKPCDWLIRFYKGNEEIESFTLENRTEQEAESEASSLFDQQEDADDWTMALTKKEMLKKSRKSSAKEREFPYCPFCKRETVPNEKGDCSFCYHPLRQESSLNKEARTDKQVYKSLEAITQLIEDGQYEKARQRLFSELERFYDDIPNLQLVGWEPGAGKGFGDTDKKRFNPHIDIGMYGLKIHDAAELEADAEKVLDALYDAMKSLEKTSDYTNNNQDLSNWYNETKPPSETIDRLIDPPKTATDEEEIAVGDIVILDDFQRGPVMSLNEDNTIDVHVADAHQGPVIDTFDRSRVVDVIKKQDQTWIKKEEAIDHLEQDSAGWKAEPRNERYLEPIGSQTEEE